MLKFFRNIRKKLAAENKVAKYLRYAIGEIFLVVIGILIALQINNWNEERKERILEKKVLKEIKSNLLLDLDELRDDISYMDDINKACEDIISFIESEGNPSEKFYEDIGKLRVTPHFDPNKSGYALLAAKGVSIILNDSLRRSLSLLYETSYPYYYRYEQERIRFFSSHVAPKLLEYFTMFFRRDLKYYSEYQITPADYIELKRDKSFGKLVFATAAENTSVQIRAKKIEKNIVTILTQLKNELESNKG